MTGAELHAAVAAIVARAGLGAGFGPAGPAGGVDGAVRDDADKPKSEVQAFVPSSSKRDGPGHPLTEP